jgi:methylenetetrahydrofolate reductase (NADPH)
MLVKKNFISAGNSKYIIIWEYNTYEMSLREDLQKKNFVITTELNPPKSCDVSEALANALKIKNLVSAVNITDNSGAGMKLSSLVLSYLIQSQTGLETIWQITCRDRNRLALQSDTLGAWALGLKNILALKGDIPPGSSSLKEEKCFDLSTDELLLAIKKMKTGEDLEGKNFKPMGNLPDFCVGSAAHPGVPNLEAQKETMLRRMDSGVEFFQTQICFEKEQIDKFIDSIGTELASKTLIGLTPLKSFKQAEFMNKNVWGVSVPVSHLEKMEASISKTEPESELSLKNQQEMGMELACELFNYITQTPLKGVHLMAIGQENYLDIILNKLVS